MTDHARALAKAAARLEQAHTDRDAAILAAAADKMPKVDIAAAVGLTRQQIGRIVAAHAATSEAEPPTE